MNINYYGILIAFLALLPQIILKLIPARKRIIVANRHKQISIIDKIALSGIIIFGIIEFEGIGYHIANEIVGYIWLAIFIILLVLLYMSHIRYYMHERRVNYLYDKVLIPCPIFSIEALIFLLSSILLVNYITIAFSLVYMITHIYLGISYNKLARFM